VTGWWFSPVSSTNKTCPHNVTEILLKVVLNTINPKPYLNRLKFEINGVKYACFESFLFRLLFSSARPHDFDGMLGTGLPVSIYTTKTPIDMQRFNVLQLKEFLAFRQISIKLFYLY
jgi:hypothetical protein